MNEEDLVCPECGNENGIEVEETTATCPKCGNVWEIGGENPEE